MSDPIEKLNRLGDALEGAPMPLPASAIRARGDRIRRRKHALVAGASAAVVAAVAVPVVAFTLDGSDDKPDFSPSPSPTVSDPVPAAPLSEENLLTSEEAVYPNGGADWQETDTFEGDGQATATPCQQTSFAGLGAGSVFQRDFEFHSTITDEVDGTLHFNQVVAEFPNEADAQAAYDEIKGWYDDCRPPGADTYDAGEFSAVPISVDGTAERQLSTYGPVEESLDPFGDEGYFLDTGLVLSGERVALLSQLTHGQDYNWPDGSPVEQMLPVAAERLVLGNRGQVAGAWPTEIPENFPLISGWPEDDGTSEFRLDRPSEDNEAMIPAGDLQACVFSPVDPGALERLTTRLSHGSDSYVRELELFPTEQVAVTYLAQLRALYQGCPTDDQNGAPPTFTTEVNPGSVGEESVVITRASDGIGRVVINVVRVGNAVLVDLASDEGSGDTVVDLATVTRENLADVIAAMNELAPTSADPGDELTDPAGTTTVPPDFPIDLALSEPPVEDDETTIDGPGPDAAGASALTMCGDEVPLPDDENGEPERELSYSVSTIGGYDGRTIHAYPTVQEAIDQMEQVRARVQGCDRDDGGDGLSDRLFRTFNSNTGYDSVTFDWYYEATDNQPAVAGQLYTVLRVGNAIVTLEWGSEGSAQSQADAAPDQVELARMMAAEMCIFQQAGC